MHRFDASILVSLRPASNVTDADDDDDDSGDDDGGGGDSARYTMTQRTDAGSAGTGPDTPGPKRNHIRQHRRDAAEGLTAMCLRHTEGRRTRGA